MTAQEIINKAMREAGFTAEFHGNTILLNVRPIEWQDIYDLHERYDAGVERIPGVECDAGQSEGYCFDIDPEEFTVKSERRLLRLLERTRMREARGNRRQQPTGREAKEHWDD